MFELRRYQKEAVDKSVSYFKDDRRKSGGLIVLPTGAGKSLVIASIAKELDGNTIIFQPSKEILEHNYHKLLSYGVEDAAVYSASFKSKQISKITFATIGSVISKKDLFSEFNNIIIDECHLVNSKSGMYFEFIDNSKAKVLGLTATPYRLSTDGFGGSILKFLTRTRPRVFTDLIYYSQINDIAENGYLAKLEYHQVRAIELAKLKANTTGADFTDESVRKHLEEINFNERLLKVLRRLSQIGRKHILVFTKFVEEAKAVAEQLQGDFECAYVCGNTHARERARILTDFKNGKVKMVANVGVLTTGFDFPELDAIVLARPTKSLALYYQMVGRGIRPHTNKEKCMIVDMCETYRIFGRVEDLVIKKDKDNLWFIESNGKKLTNEYFN